MVRSALCYGDSNTWGSDPTSPYDRFPPDVRWTGVTARELGADWQVVEAGLGDRTTVFERLPLPYRSGRDLLVPTMDTHHPLDVVLIMLGTNDVYIPYLEIDAIVRGAGELVLMVQEASDFGPSAGVAPQVLLIAPPVVGPLPPKEMELYGGAVERSEQLGEAYEGIAELLHCSFLDLAPLVKNSPVDGWHLDAAGHHTAGLAMAGALRGMFL